MNELDIISPDTAVTLPGLFRERARRSAPHPAYRYFDDATQCWSVLTWTQMEHAIARWQRAFEGEGLQPGDRIAIMIRNGPEWVQCEQAALGLGLVVVPLYVNDRAANAAYILRDAEARFLLIEGDEQWNALAPVREELNAVRRIVSLRPVAPADKDPRVRALNDWLPAAAEGGMRVNVADTGALATIVYTSGTTGYPKGVMLSHRNILWNAHSCLRRVPIFGEDLFLSFLPLSHMLERTVGHYLPIMAGAVVAYARSIPNLAEDIQTLRPTVLISVPRIFERVHARIISGLDTKPAWVSRLFHLAVTVGWHRFQRGQGRASWHPRELCWPLLRRAVAQRVLTKLGGRLRVAICGGAPLAGEMGRTLIALGVPLFQGYGLTEASPVISTNHFTDNDPASVGAPLEDVTARIGENGELLIKSPGVTAGYWNRPQASAELIDGEGWLHTGDKARIEDGRIYITGRIKDIIVLANGEKVSPADMEAALLRDPLFEQVMVIGEGKPYLSVLAVLNSRHAAVLGVTPGDGQSLHSRESERRVLERIGKQLTAFPGYAQVRRAAFTFAPWTVDNGLLTPTLKLRRAEALRQHESEIAHLYTGH